MVRGAGVPVVVACQDDVVPAQGRDVPGQARVGHARVSTHDQQPEAQNALLIEAGAIRVFSDVISGKRFGPPTRRPPVRHLPRPSGALALGTARDRRRPRSPRHPPGWPRGAYRRLHGHRRTPPPRVRRYRAFPAMAHFRAHARRNRRGAEARPNAGSTAARFTNGFRGSEAYRNRPIARENGNTAWNWQSNGLSNRPRDARGGFVCRPRDSRYKSANDTCCSSPTGENLC